MPSMCFTATRKSLQALAPIYRTQARPTMSLQWQTHAYRNKSQAFIMRSPFTTCPISHLHPSPFCPRQAACCSLDRPCPSGSWISPQFPLPNPQPADFLPTLQRAAQTLPLPWRFSWHPGSWDLHLYYGTLIFPVYHTLTLETDTGKAFWSPHICTNH